MKQFYKKDPNKKNISCVESLTGQDRIKFFDFSNPKISENENLQLIPFDFVKDLQSFQDAIVNISLDIIQEKLNNLPIQFLNCQPNEKTFRFLIESDIINYIFQLLIQPPLQEMYNPTIWLVLSIIQMAFKYQKEEIIEKIATLDLFDFLLSRFNPNFQNDLKGEKNSFAKIDLNTFEIDLLPYYFHLFAYYCILLNEEGRDIIINIVIFPNRDILFDDLDNTDLVRETSFLIRNSTIYSLEKDQIDYINWIITAIIQNFRELDSTSQSFLLNSVLNLTEIDDFTPYLFQFCFEKLLSNYINEDDPNKDDSVMNFVLTLLKKLLEADPSRVNIDYEKMIKYFIISTSSDSNLFMINPSFQHSKSSAFELFREGIELAESESPLSNDIFFHDFMCIFKNGSFDIKSEFLRIIDVWIRCSSQELISKRAPYIIPEIAELLEGISVTDQLNLVLLQVIKAFFTNSDRDSPENFLDLIIIFENSGGVDYLDEMTQDEELPEENCQLAQDILSIWS